MDCVSEGRCVVGSKLFAVARGIYEDSASVCVVVRKGVCDRVLICV